ncbi:MAG: hypothetical protein M1821_008109 [Bathelium mastoideum]|nr:MAG: hypothetical protein M1821_008109 [Bathelium mastoideum]KAI9693152.1 MAG: hypothetical protein M1822_005148 [Bathelium mastoideum]
MEARQQIAEEGRVSNTPYQLDSDQTLKAATALLAHIKKEQEQRSSKASKRDLLAEAAASSDDDEDVNEEGEPVWLVLTTKKFIVDKARLKPGKISNVSTICLFTCDPATPYKEILQHSSFPVSLSQRISQTVPIAKLKTQYKPFETRRQLVAQHDLFLADDRIITYLPSLLGKTFYKSGSKRPIPVNLAPKAERVDGKRVKKDKKHALTPLTSQKDRAPAQVATPEDAAKELEKALKATTVQLSPSTSTSIRVGRSGKAWTPEMLKENIEVAVSQLVDKWVPGKWRGVRALYVKGERTASLPVWMTQELWEKEDDVLDRSKENEGSNEDVYQNEEVKGENKTKALQGRSYGESKKRKGGEVQQTEERIQRKKMKNDIENAGTATTSKKRRLEKQKDAVMEALEA